MRSLGIMVTTRLRDVDIEGLDLLAEEAGVTRADVIRAGVDIVLHGVERDRVLTFLARRKREAT